MVGEHTPEPWEAKDVPGQGWQIHARVPELDRTAMIQEVPIQPQLSIADGKVYVCLSYESFVQFPSDDWEKMQTANAQLMVEAPTQAARIKELKEACREGQRMLSEVGGFECEEIERALAGKEDKSCGSPDGS